MPYTHEERAVARRTLCCSHGQSPGALKPHSSGLDIAYVWLRAATMSGAWLSLSC
jgi:hypothetical protein